MKRLSLLLLLAVSLALSTASCGPSTTLEPTRDVSTVQPTATPSEAPTATPTRVPAVTSTEEPVSENPPPNASLGDTWTTHLPDVVVTAIAFDEQGRAWIGTGDGVSVCSSNE